MTQDDRYSLVKNGKSDSLWQEALSFCELNKGSIIKKIKRFKVYSSGLDIEDFFQEALIVAFETASEIQTNHCPACQNRCSSMNNCKNYQKIFWGKLKSRFCQSDLTDIPSEYKLNAYKKHSSSKNPSKKPFKRFSIEESMDEESFKDIILLKIEDRTLESFDKEDFNKKRNELRLKLLSLFTQKEKEIFFLLEQGKSIDEITKAFNYRFKNAVYIALRRMQKKAENLL